jgi:hypothetical protein
MKVNCEQMFAIESLALIARGFAGEQPRLVGARARSRFA